jgi:uncharacterized protein
LPDVICNTSPLQYLHQIDLLHLLPALVHEVVIPPAVVEEIGIGRSEGVNLPDVAILNWIRVQHPRAEVALPLVSDLGPGETEVLMLGLELPDSIVILDDRLGRRVAETLSLKYTGTLGLLLDAKRAGIISSVRPFLDLLHELRFHLALSTRRAVLQLAGEET